MLRDLLAAFAFFTVLPASSQASKPGRVFAYTPLVGLVVGAALALVASNTLLSREMTAFAMLLLWVVLTGGLHLDGLADFCDGVLSTAAPERRLAIMKDPQAGTWAVVGVVLLLLGKWVALREVSPLLLIAPPVLGRWAMTLAAYGFPYARQTGTGGYFRDGLGRVQVVAATMLALVFTLPLIVVNPFGTLAAMVAAPLAAFLVGRWTARRLGGGLTGDVYGAICEGVELLALWLLVIF